MTKTLIVLCLLFAGSAQAADEMFGPFNGSFIPDGTGLEKQIKTGQPPVAAAAHWSMYCWVRSEGPVPRRTLIAGVGDRFLALLDRKVSFTAGQGSLPGTAELQLGAWHLLAATYDGSTVRIYFDGSAAGEQAMSLNATTPTLIMAPDSLPWKDGSHFAGRIANFTLLSTLLSAAEIHALLDQRASLEYARFEDGSKDWPVQTRAQAGYRAPQDPGTMPKSTAPFTQPVSKPPYSGPVLVSRAPNEWTIAGGWKLSRSADGPGIDATVPGTVLTTYLDRGSYPDPDFGLNNLSIPESLSKQDYWYRTQFTPEANLAGRRLTLTFNGINYSAIVFLNGKRLGEIRGAFIRGIFDVTGTLLPGKSNALAVHIFPPPHPGIAHEQSIKAGPGENGGLLCLDGPTFVAAEGWDWIPGIRDRNIGIWQDVTLRATADVKIGDPLITSKLPLPDTTRADVKISVPLVNASETQTSGVLEASFEGVTLTKNVSLPPGESSVDLTAAVSNPRLWWPNGYGKPELYHLKLAFRGAQGESDQKIQRFGIREITYELSLMDATGHLRRIEYAPTAANGVRVLDTSNEGTIHSSIGWVASIRAGQENSVALKTMDDLRAAPFLTIRVNGVRIACKGGSWGMDDSRKRVSRERLEPYFRLHRDANITMIRNWVGQSTEEVFYELADEYGLLVWNDFWESTQNYNVEPSDTALFLSNARDTILRFRNHPSIVMWCGRNEGMPSPAVNEGLDELTRTLDGTRHYMPTSNQVNLQNSGPYLHREAEDYFTKLSVGFAVEVGIPSLPTLESMRAMLPQQDQWPPNDTWAYHDWHFGGNGDTAPFMRAIEKQFGAADNLEDFERKAQMINYVNHRAIFEGMNAHLWAPNSGRMLWMTQPAWPSTNWQILSSDYDTHASFFGVKKGCEPIHVQMNLPDRKIAVVNNTTKTLENILVRARVFSGDGKLQWTHEARLTATPNATTEAFAVEGSGYVKLELPDLKAENFYWDSTALPQAEVGVSAQQQGSHLTVTLTNSAATVALMNKLTLFNKADGSRVLPVYYSDNYVSLLPGEKRTITVEIPATKGPLEIALRGWNARLVRIEPNR